MGYDEVETILPLDYVPRPDPLPTARATLPAAMATTDDKPGTALQKTRKKKKKRKKEAKKEEAKSGGLLGRWRAWRRKSKGGAKRSAKTAKAPSTRAAKIQGKSLRRVDTNDTEKRTNTSKAQGATKERADSEMPVAKGGAVKAVALAKSRSAASPDSARSARSSKAAASGERAVPTIPSLRSDVESVRSERSNRSARSTSSAGPTAGSEDRGPPALPALTSMDASVRSAKSNRSSAKSVKSPRSVTWSQAEAVKEKGGSHAANGATSDAAESARETWTQKVSLSIGGYETSFQFLDPASSLAAIVNDALAAAGGSQVDGKPQDQSPKELDKTGDVDEERDYDVNPTDLVVHLQRRDWDSAFARLRSHPAEAHVWVYRRARARTCKAAPAVPSTALVAHEGNLTPHLRWRLLPLHAAITLGAPAALAQELARTWPGAARETDERGSLPVHLAAARLDVDEDGEKVVLQLFGVHPESIELRDRKGRTPADLARLARARRDVRERRRDGAASQRDSQAGMDCTASQRGHHPDTGSAASTSGGKDKKHADAGIDGNEEKNGVGSGDDEGSVMSRASGRFRRIALRKSRSTDTMDRRKRKVAESSALGFNFAKSVDDGDHAPCEEADDRSVASSLGPGFALLETPLGQEAQERAVSRDDGALGEGGSGSKAAEIGKEYRVPEEAPPPPDARLLDLPLPASFCDDSSVRSASSKTSTSSKTTTGSTASGTSPCQSGEELTSTARAMAESPPPTADDVVTGEMANEAGPTSMVGVMTSDSTATDETADTPSTAHEASEANEGLIVLLEKAAENAGRAALDVAPFVQVLEDEWVYDVEALRLLDSGTLDDLLPLMLSRQLQRLIHHADGIDATFLEEEQSDRGSGRDHSPKKNSKKKNKTKKKQSPQTAKKERHPLTPISEATENPSPVSSKTKAMSVLLAQSTPPALPMPPKDDRRGEEEDVSEDPGAGGEERDKETAPLSSDKDLKTKRCNVHLVEEAINEDQGAGGEDHDKNTTLSSSAEYLKTRRLHADLVAKARTRFTTRASLEDAIAVRRAEVSAAVNCGFDVEPETLSRAALADDEVRRLLPLRMLLPAVADLSEMIKALQEHGEGHAINEEEGCAVQSDIEELRKQIDREEQYF